MPCGGCGGGDIRIAPRRSTASIPKRTQISVQRELRPKPIQRVATPPKPQVRKKVRSPELVKMSKNRALDTRLCPICGASLSIEITGKTRRKRFRCTKCQKTYT
jgi:hypothetical protein